jgi:hypothetical protein
MEEETSVIVEIYDQMIEQLRAGSRDGAFSVLRDRISELPEEVQGQILTLMLEDAVDTEHRAEQTKKAIGQEGIAMIQALEALKAQLEKEQTAQ